MGRFNEMSASMGGKSALVSTRYGVEVGVVTHKFC